LLFTERGMALTAIAGFFAAHSLTVAALELPTGGLSDALGRRPVLAVAGALNAIALVIHGLAGTAWVLVLGMVLMGAARALASGPRPQCGPAHRSGARQLRHRGRLRRRNRARRCRALAARPDRRPRTAADGVDLGPGAAAVRAGPAGRRGRDRLPLLRPERPA